MTSTTMVHVRIDEDTEAQATQTLAALGLSVSDAVRLFLRRVVIEQGLPLSLEVPNAETQAAMREARIVGEPRFIDPETCSVPSRTTSKERRAALPRRVEYAKSFVKEPEWSDHALAGEWRDHRECHVGGDVLLIYRVAGDDGVVFVRAGSHAELFE